MSITRDILSVVTIMLSATRDILGWWFSTRQLNMYTPMYITKIYTGMMYIMYV